MNRFTTYTLTLHSTKQSILSMCFRSHRHIIDIPSQLFYDGDLIPLAPPEIQDRYLGLDLLPNKDCPIVFHGVRG